MSQIIKVTKTDSCDTCQLKKGCGVQDPKDKKCMANNFEEFLEEAKEEDYEDL